MQLAIGSDHRGRELYRVLCEHLSKDARFDLRTFASEEITDYPDIASTVAQEVSSGFADFGILICGTGIGMSVVANKYPGVRAAPCHNELMAEFSRRHNNANVLCLSGDMLGDVSGLRIVTRWLETPFEGGRHEHRLEKIREIEHRHRPVSILEEDEAFVG